MFSKAKELRPRIARLRGPGFPLRVQTYTDYGMLYKELTAQKEGKLMLFGTTLEFRRSFGCTGRSRAAPSRTTRFSRFGSHRGCRRFRCRRSRCWRGGLVEKPVKAKSWPWKRRGSRQRGSHRRDCGRRSSGGRTPNAVRQRTQCVTGKTGLFRIRRSFCVLCQCGAFFLFGFGGGGSRPPCLQLRKHGEHWWKCRGRFLVQE